MFEETNSLESAAVLVVAAGFVVVHLRVGVEVLAGVVIRFSKSYRVKQLRFYRRVLKTRWTTTGTTVQLGCSY